VIWLVFVDCEQSANPFQNQSKCLAREREFRLAAGRGGNGDPIGSPDTEYKIWIFAEVVEGAAAEQFKRRLFDIVRAKST
jgi:hypothetical protein